MENQEKMLDFFVLLEYNLYRTTGDDMQGC